jgi:hypothetical protein
VIDNDVRASNELVEETLPSIDRNGVVEGSGCAALDTIGDHLSRNHGYQVVRASGTGQERRSRVERSDGAERMIGVIRKAEHQSDERRTSGDRHWRGVALAGRWRAWRTPASVLGDGSA